MSYYSLRNKKTKKLIGFTVSSNEGCEFCNDTRYELCDDEDQIWVVKSELDIKNLFTNPSPKWYNSSYSNPICDLKLSDYEIVELEVK